MPRHYAALILAAGLALLGGCGQMGPLYMPPPEAAPQPPPEQAPGGQQQTDTP